MRYFIKTTYLCTLQKSYYIDMRKLSYLYIILVPFLIISCGHDKIYKIGVSQCSDDDWRQKMNAEIKRELMFHPEASVEILSAGDNSAKQIEDIRYFINNGFDAIIAAPNEADALTPIINEAYSKGIPVVLFDRNINGDSYTAWQGADNHSIGRAAARYAIAKRGINAKTVEIYGLQGSTPADDRHTGFNSVDDLNVVAYGFGNWNYDDAVKVTDSLIRLHPDLDVIYAHNDRMAVAASDVARQHGVRPLIVGTDAAPQIGLKAVADSSIDATFLYPTEGHRLLRTALAILQGEPYSKHTVLPATPPVDSSNIDILLLQNESLNEETGKMELLKAEIDEYWTQHTSQTALFYAVLAIVILLFGLLFMLLRAFWQHKRHQRTLVKQNILLQEERDKQKILNDQLDAAMSSKLAFFTNVSHDLRTPLTLIAEPIEQIAESENIDDREKFLMKIARKNIHILHRLINNILDLRKYENDKLKLKPTESDIVHLLREWSNAFVAMANRRKIDFAFDHPGVEQLSMAIDVEKLESVFYNIVSNAFKYTAEGGSININLSCEPENIKLVISDTGIGIPANELPYIFDHFFQGDRIHHSGSGIGLALVKAFVELHRGTIDVESTVGKGTVFTIIIPIFHVETLPDSTVKTSLKAETVDIELGEITHQNDVVVSPDQRVVLVIDDNPDICALLSELLSDKYVVISAYNGQEGIRLAQKYVPDLIICDVMMPVMNGLECCRILKTDVTTSHIPILMLTACTLDEQRAAGYEVGADGYLSKPFNTAVLFARIKNLIESRQQIRRADLPEKTDSPAVSETANPLTSIENKFYNKFLEIFKTNMSDPDLSVETIASTMGLGYSQLYRKIKSLTNLRPVELMRQLRLEKARELVLTSDNTISEISYAVGFSNPAYFTKCYRDLYGETPTETREKG